MSQPQSQSLSLYTDESSQHTGGRLFVGAGVVVTDNLPEIEQLCLAAEDSSGKQKDKWGQTKHTRRMVYLNRLLQDPLLRGNLYWSAHTNTTNYDLATVDTLAYILASHPVPGPIIYVDALQGNKRRNYARRLRNRDIRPKAVRNIAKDENNPIIRLADALAGFCMDDADGLSDI